MGALSFKYRDFYAIQLRVHSWLQKLFSNSSKGIKKCCVPSSASTVLEVASLCLLLMLYMPYIFVSVSVSVSVSVYIYWYFTLKMQNNHFCTGFKSCLFLFSYLNFHFCQIDFCFYFYWCTTFLHLPSPDASRSVNVPCFSFFLFPSTGFIANTTATTTDYSDLCLLP